MTSTGGMGVISTSKMFSPHSRLHQVLCNYFILLQKDLASVGSRINAVDIEDAGTNSLAVVCYEDETE